MAVPPAVPLPVVPLLVACKASSASEVSVDGGADIGALPPVALPLAGAVDAVVSLIWALVCIEVPLAAPLAAQALLLVEALAACMALVLASAEAWASVPPLVALPEAQALLPVGVSVALA